MKNILMFGMSSYPGGIENYIKNYFCNDIFSEHFHIDFVTYEGCLAYEKEIDHAHHSILKVPHLKKNPFGYFKAINKAMQTTDYDFVYVNMLSCANFLPVLLASSNKVKNLVLHAHASNTVGALRKIMHRLFKEFCNRHATLCLACGEQAGKWLFGDREFTVVPNAIDAGQFCYSEENRNRIRTQLGITETDLVFGHIGRFAPEKNHGFMLEFFGEWLKSHGSKNKLLFVGDGGLRDEIQHRAEQMGLQDHVIFFGTTDCAWEIYPAFDYFLFPSTFEGFGMSVLEAQACGRKCFVADTLPKAVNVSGTVCFLPIDNGVSCWIDAVNNADNNMTPMEMNQKIKDSEYDIYCQVKRLVNLLGI